MGKHIIAAWFGSYCFLRTFSELHISLRLQFCIFWATEAEIPRLWSLCDCVHCPIFWISCRLSRTGNCSWSSASHCFSEVKNLSWNSLVPDFCSHLQILCKGKGMDQEKPALDQRAQDLQGWFQVHAGEEAEVSAVYQGFLLILLQQGVCWKNLCFC